MIHGELIVDNFAGGGGASTGIEMATGYSVDIAINHDPEAIKMHKANHPNTKHYCENVWAVDPVKACKGHPVALAWFSPDCKHFSKAKGGKPKDKNIRGLAWVACRWAGLVRPRVIMLENVEEFKTWGPLGRRHHPIKAKQGETFQKFVQQLTDLGYEVQFRELIAADYGAPTMRKRFFMIARCDGKPIVWPEPTHAPADSEEVKAGLKKPYVGAYTQIDFSRPCPSIFDTSEEIKEKYGIRAVRPLAQKTMDRIARGFIKFVLNNPKPFIIQCNHGGERRPNDIREPMPTITGKHGYGIVEPYMVQIGQTGFTKDRSKDVREPLTTIVSKNEHCLISPTLIQYHSETSKDGVRGQTIEDPIMTVDSSNRYGLVTSFLHKYYDGGYKGAGETVENPLPTVTAWDHNSVVTANLIQMNNHCDGKDIRQPLPTITAGDGHFGEVRAFLIKYYGQGTGQDTEKTESSGTEASSDDESQDAEVSRDLFAMDTYMTLTAYGEHAQEAVDKAAERVGALDALLSTGDENSEIYQLNQKGEATLSEDGGYLVERALELYDKTEGAFDIAIYPVMQAWGFPTQEYHVPDDATLKEKLILADASKVNYDKDTRKISFDRDGMEIDLGGIAKGYTSAQIMQIYQDCGVTSGLVNLGGNVQALGCKTDGSKWKVAIQSPDDTEDYLGILEIENQAVITSGGYERYFEEDGVTYHHIIDPATGYPADSGLISVTIVSDDGTLADGLSTSLFIMGEEKAAQFWKENNEKFETIMETADGKLYVTEGIADSLTTDMDVTVIHK